MSILQMGGLVAALLGAGFFIVEKNYKDAFTMFLIALLYVS